MDKVNEEQNAKRINEVENCFGKDGQALISPGRILLGEGTLIKVCRKKSKLRKFFLFTDILVYGNILIDKKKYYNQHILPLEEIQIESLKDTEELKNAWQIKGKTKSFVVQSMTSVEKEEWTTYLNICINERLRKLGKPIQDVHAPVWVPDSKAQECMNCKTSEFTFFNRRHHCRKCGYVVCYACSKNKLELQEGSSKKERVCLTCYKILTNGVINNKPEISPEKKDE